MQVSLPIKELSFTLALTLSAVLLSGCEVFSPSSGDSQAGLYHQMEAPDEVQIGESFEVIYSLTNHTPENVEVTTPHSCLVLPAVYEFSGSDKGERVPFRGSMMGCLTVVTTHTIPAGDSLELTFEIEAKFGSSKDEPVDPGTYVIRIEPEFHEIRGIPFQSLEKKLTVTE